ncbi:sh3 containing grb2 protein 3 [Echinococcus multilocularis]|uniref:Sh3 containing grb2 protein 3 n=1 Tax=Echinococcus multilocularis TaxID=6211 RepID=A0A068YDL5_ECHMU|nr:sh3 containing grb2 protein 3 [Echinococcus multilocularis]
MSFTGLRKQINKANQFMSEKIGGAEGTKLDEEYIHCEKQIDAMSKLIEEIITKTHEYLQPNPATRAKLATLNTFNKIQGKGKAPPYPQPEGQLGDCMLKYGNELDHDSLFGECLIQTGYAFKNMEDIKYNMEDQVKREYIEPLRGIQSVELKEINFHRKKLEGRRLDFDCKKRKKESNILKNPQAAKVLEAEIKVAEEKFQESKVLAETAMANFLASDFEHISALAEFVDAQANYYRHASEIMENLHKVLLEKKDEAQSRGKQIHNPKPLQITRTLSGEVSTKNGSMSSPRTPNKSPASTGGSGPCCRALYQFEAENDTELAFSEGDIIQLIRQVDENWFEGRLRDKEGFFPVNYVENLRCPLFPPPPRLHNKSPDALSHPLTLTPRGSGNQIKGQYIDAIILHLIYLSRFIRPPVFPTPHS